MSLYTCPRCDRSINTSETQNWEQTDEEGVVHLDCSAAVGQSYEDLEAKGFEENRGRQVLAGSDGGLMEDPEQRRGDEPGATDVADVATPLDPDDTDRDGTVDRSELSGDERAALDDKPEEAAQADAEAEGGVQPDGGDQPQDA